VSSLGDDSLRVGVERGVESGGFAVVVFVAVVCSGTELSQGGSALASLFCHGTAHEEERVSLVLLTLAATVITTVAQIIPIFLVPFANGA
jgi:hypothetical protein